MVLHKALGRIGKHGLFALQSEEEEQAKLVTRHRDSSGNSRCKTLEISNGRV